MWFFYSLLTNTYFDPAHYSNGKPAGSISTTWDYLTGYMDANSGIGANVHYATAYNNTNGTPNRTDSHGNIIDDRHDPLYCFTYATDCSGNYAHPDQQAWSIQVATQIQASGKDSSALTSFATTKYSYTLAITGEYKTGTGACYPYPSPSNYQPGQNDCVGDNWIPASGGTNDSDWGDYYHAEYRGFASVNITGPHGDLTVDNYASTEGWGTPDADFANYGAGSLMSEYVYQGGQAVSTALLHNIATYYAGGPLINHTPPVDGATACVSPGATDTVYTPCEVMVLNTQTYEVNGASGTEPSVENDFTYDDYTVSGWASGGYHQLQQEVTTSSDAPAFTKKWTYYTNAAVGGSWTTYNVDSVKHSEVDDSGNPVHIWQCQYTTYDEGSGVTAPSASWPTTLQTYNNSNCGSPGPNNTMTTNYLGYDAFGNAVATVDGVAQANSPVYSSNGCTLSRPPIFTSTSNWAANLNYTSCITYDSHNAQPTKVTYPLAPPSSLNLSTSVAYDDSQGSLPITSTDMNGQMTTTSYSYHNGNLTTQQLIPPDTSGYTTQASTNTSCSSTSTLPCFEVDSNASQYTAAVSSTISDALGRVVETSTPGPDPANPAPGKSYFTVVLTEYKDDSTHSVWQSNPFVVAVSTTQQSPGWIDPNNAVDYGNNAPGGSVTFYDALGRPIAFDDPIFVAKGSSGISCPSLGSNATSCTLYGLGQASGTDTNTYAQVTNIDPNNHMTTSYVDILGRVVYGQLYSGTYGSTTLTEQKAIQYNVLSEPTQVKVIDEAQIGTPSITTTASYDDLGRLTTLNDPDRGTHNYTYDADGRLITDASTLVTLGYSYDLMGRLGCVQDQPPPSPVSPTGACSSSGVSPFAQYTYDVSAPGANWSGNDYPKGRLTQTYAINYFPGPDFTQGKVTEQTQYDARGRAINENLLVTATGGTLTFPTFPTYKLNLQYNDADQVTSAQTSSSPSGLGFTAAPIYDSMTGVEVGLGTTVSTSPNVASITYNAQALISNINFLANSTTTVATESFQYDGDLRPNSANACWQTACTTPPACPTAAFFCQGLNYDAASNIINLSTTQATVPGTTNSGGSETQVFCYDEQNRLVWAGNNATQPSSCSGNGTPANTLNNAGYHVAYSFNNLGQITSGPYNGIGATQQYLYCDSNHPHALTAVDATGSTCSSQTGTNYSASYDAHGNMTSRAVKSGSSLDTQTLAFDGLDHLVRWNDTVTTSNEEWYMYDASGDRVLQRSTTGSGSSNTSITVYAFGLEEHIYNGAGTLTNSKYYYSLAGRLLGKTSGSGAPTFYLTDTLGSVLASFRGASGTSAVAGNQTYGPYGNVQYNKGLMGTAKGFTGQYKDDLSGLNNFGARYYDQLVGIFVSADTVQGNQLGDDPYAYVGGNPENFNDPTGRLPGPACQNCTSDPASILIQTQTLSGGVGGNTNRLPVLCVELGTCKTHALVDNGSSPGIVTTQNTLLCIGIAVDFSSFSIGGCASGGNTYIVRRDNPPTDTELCTSTFTCPPEGEHGNSSNAEGQDKTDDGLLFADSGGDAPQYQPKRAPADDTQAVAGQPTEPSSGPANRGARSLAAKLFSRLRATGVNLTHTTLAVGFREDGMILISLNLRASSTGSFEDPVATELQNILASQDGVQYVGPTSLTSYGNRFQHAEEYILASVNRGELVGIGSATRGICRDCLQLIGQEQPQVLPGLK
ncbi:MAG: RHS repeat-associated core domain-containing protein [Ktedonobacteraceae bacterium]